MKALWTGTLLTASHPKNALVTHLGDEMENFTSLTMTYGYFLLFPFYVDFLRLMQGVSRLWRMVGWECRGMGERTSREEVTDKCFSRDIHLNPHQVVYTHYSMTSPSSYLVATWLPNTSITFLKSSDCCAVVYCRKTAPQCVRQTWYNSMHPSHTSL